MSENAVAVRMPGFGLRLFSDTALNSLMGDAYCWWLLSRWRGPRVVFVDWFTQQLACDGPGRSNLQQHASAGLSGEQTVQV